MQERIITLATPVFFVLIALELLAARLMRRRVYQLDDAISSIGLGVLSQISGVFSRLLRIGLYALAYEHVALCHLPANSLLVWLFALLLYDFCYYWLHRAGHEVNVLWAAHVVHHQSEDYNLSTALRQTSSGVLLGWLFYLPLAILGVPVEIFAVVALIDLLYQFWIHTELIGRLGWFDRWFASPSNHRVHHAVNQRYLDRNYGGIFILWDRLFGTFKEEDAEEPAVFGTRAPLRTFNPLWANAEVYAAMMRDSARARSVRDVFCIWFGPPGWQSEDLKQRFPRADFDIKRERYTPSIGALALIYGTLQFAVLLAMSVHFLQMQQTASIAEQLAYCIYLTVTLFSLGAWFDGRRYALVLEALRVVASAAAALSSGLWFGSIALVPLSQVLVTALMLFSLALLLLSWRQQRGALGLWSVTSQRAL